MIPDENCLPTQKQRQENFRWRGFAYFIDDDNMVYIAEGAGVSILTMDGRLIAQWVVTGGPNDRPHGAHGIWVDSQGSIFLGEVGVGDLLHKYERV